MEFDMVDNVGWSWIFIVNKSGVECKDMDNLFDVGILSG